MKKALLSFVMALVMILTSLPISAQATGTPKLVYRFAGYDQEKDLHYEMSNNMTDTTMNTNVGNGSPVTLYFVDSSGKETLLRADQVTSSDIRVLTFEVDSQVPEVVHLRYVGVGTAKINYEHDNVTYSIDVTVDLPMVGFYTTPSADQSSYITEFTVTDSANTVYLVANNGTLSNVQLSTDFDQIADVQLSSDGTYATITITGTPDGRYYDVQAYYTGNNGNSGNNGASINLINGKPSLMYSWINWNNDPPSPDPYLNSSIRLAKGYSNDIYVYFVGGGTSKSSVVAGSLVSSDETVVTVAASQQYGDIVVLQPVGFGNATISYAHTDGKTYSFDVTVGLPDIGYYTTPSADQNSYITEFTVTDSANTVYLVANNGTLSNVQLSTDFDQIADVQLSSDGTYATITITGTPDGRYYDVQAYYTGNNGSSGNNGASINLINGKPSLMMRFPNFSGNGPEEDLNNALESSYIINKGQNEPGYFYFVSGGSEMKIFLSDLKSSDEDIVKVTVYDGSDAIVMESGNCGTAEIQYTVNGVTYGFPVVVRLPEIACYSNQTVSEATFVKEYTVTETANQLYILARDGQKIVEVNLLRELQGIAKVEVAADNSYALLTVEGDPEGWNYDYEVLMEETDGRQEYFYGNITLNNGKTRLAFCWPEDTPSGHGEFGTCLDTAVGYATDVWVYLTDGTNETKVEFADLKSSDDSVLKVVDPGYDNGMVNLKTVGWGEATVSYTSNGKTYSFDVVSDLQSFGYYTEQDITRENWIRGFTVTEENKTFYFMAADGITFDVLTPTAALEDIADIKLSDDKTYVTITITGTPTTEGDYGFEFEFKHPNGDQGHGNDILDFIKEDVKVSIEDLPSVDASKPVENVTVGVDQSKSEEALEATAKEIIEAIIDGASTDVVDDEVVESIKEALESGAQLEVKTSVVVENLDEADLQSNEFKEDVKDIENALGDAEIAQYLNLEVVVTTYVDGNERASSVVSELDKPIVFTIALPDDIKKVPEGYNREIYIIYVHEGDVKTIPVTKNVDGTVSFSADEFSTYALAYKDTKKSNQSSNNESTSNSGATGSGTTGNSTTAPQEPVRVTVSLAASPNTSDNSSVADYMSLLVAAVAMLMGLLAVKRRSGRA